MGKTRRDSKGRAFRKGEGIRKDGLYRFTYTDPTGKRKSLYAKDLPELREKEKQLQHDRLDGLDLYLSQKADINFVFDRYIATKRDLRVTTETSYRYTYDRYVRDGFGKRRISSVRYSDVILFYHSILNQGLSVATVDNIHTVLCPTFQMAVRDMIIRVNPAEGALGEIKRSKKNASGPRQALSYEEESAFLNYIEDTPEEGRWVPLFNVMFGTGCRVGEIIGLRWDDIDFDRNTISIKRSISYCPRFDRDRRSEYVISEPKTKSGIRTIPMLKKVKEALLKEKENQRYFGYYCFQEVEGITGFVFCNRYGNLLNPSGINKVIHRIVSDYNAKEIITAAKEHRDPLVLPQFSCHITRHTFCSRLCENETNVKVIQEVMGHKDIQTTLGIYAEVSEQKKQESFLLLNEKNVL